MTITFQDNKGSTRILNLSQINQISYEEDSRYFMVYFTGDTETFTFKSAEYRDKVLNQIHELMNAREI